VVLFSAREIGLLMSSATADETPEGKAAWWLPTRVQVSPTLAFIEKPRTGPLGAAKLSGVARHGDVMIAIVRLRL
jgi:hypothetical protein